MADVVKLEILPLFDALVAWGDPVLVEAVRDQERRFTPGELARADTWPTLSCQTDLRAAEQPGCVKAPPDFATLNAAWRMLERDFKRRLVAGEIWLRGVLTWPTRLTDYVKIPGVWAADFEFELFHDALRITGARYVAVMAHRPAARSAMGVRSEAGYPGNARDDEADDAPPDKGTTQARRRGRQNYDSIIAQILRENWPDIRVRAEPQDGSAPNWSAIARLLYARLEKQARRNPEVVVPQLNTFRQRLPRIYAALLIEKPDQC